MNEYNDNADIEMDGKSVRTLIVCITIVLTSWGFAFTSCAASDSNTRVAAEKTAQALAMYRIDYERLDAQRALLRERGEWPSAPAGGGE